VTGVSDRHHTLDLKICDRCNVCLGADEQLFAIRLKVIAVRFQSIAEDAGA
jgi:hypothetical protein